MNLLRYKYQPTPQVGKPALLNLVCGGVEELATSSNDYELDGVEHLRRTMRPRIVLDLPRVVAELLALSRPSLGSLFPSS